MSYPPATYIDSDDEDKDEYDNENGAIGGTIGGFHPTIGPNINNKDNQNRKVVKLGKYDHQTRHRVVREGMHFQGKCQNEDCEKQGEMVWVTIGYGFINFADQVFECPCPICNVKLRSQTITNIGYRYAKVKFTGRKSNGEKVSFEDIQKDGNFIKFLGDKNGQKAEWVSLMIDVQQL